MSTLLRSKFGFLTVNSNVAAKRRSEYDLTGKRPNEGFGTALDESGALPKFLRRSTPVTGTTDYFYA